MVDRYYKNLYGCEVSIEKSVWGSLFGIMRLCWVMPNSDPEGRIFLSALHTYDRFFFLHSLRVPGSDFNVEVAMNESCSYTLMSAILKIDGRCDVAITSTPNVLTTELRDLLYNQWIDNMYRYAFFIPPTGRMRVCKVRFVSTGENRGRSCLVCKKNVFCTPDKEICDFHMG